MTSTTTVLYYGAPMAPVTGVAVGVGVGAVQIINQQQQQQLLPFQYQIRTTMVCTNQRTGDGGCGANFVD